MKKLLFATSFLFCLTLFIPSCVKTEFDEPPTTGVAVDIPESDIVSISSLKNYHNGGSIETLNELLDTDGNGIFDGKYIKGTVAADDESGNFYKTFILQDASGGIAVKVGRTDFYPFYSVGREVYVKLSGLFMGDFRGVIQLGGFINGDFELDDIVNTDAFIIPGERGAEITPTLKTIGGLNQGDISTLVMFENVEFVNGAFNLTYADAPNQSTENRNVEDCDGNVIVVRTSGYADFAATDIPDGNGTIIGIYSIYEAGANITQQLLIRSAEDVVMEGERCDGSNGGGGEPGEPVDELFEDFNSFSDNDVYASTGWSNFAVLGSRQWAVGEFQGVKAAEFTGFGASENELESWLITPPINLDSPKYLSFKSAFAFYAHDAVQVLISTDYVGGNPNDATWTDLEPTLADGAINDWNEYIPSGDVEISGFGDVGFIAFKYVGNNSDQTTNWLIDDIRVSSTPDDNGGGGGGGDDEPLDELILDLESLSLSDNDDFVEAGWVNIATIGTRKWQFNIFDDNADLRTSAFNDTNPEMEAWLITPVIDFTTPKQMNFLNGFAFYVHDGLTVWFSNDYDSGDPSSATWEEIDYDIAPSSNANYDLSPSGEIDLSDYSGNGRIAFKYNGNSSNETTTWIIDELSITDL